MKKHLLASIALLATFGGSAMAADMPVKARPAPVCPGCNWNGWYIGANVGGSIGWDRKQDNVSVLPGGVPFGGVFPGVFNPVASIGDTRSPVGVIGGAQIGFNWEANHWLFGLEADFNWTSQRDTLISQNFLASTVAAASATVAFTDEQRLRWLTTWRARLGWTYDCWLWYVTGGAAWGEVESNYSLTQVSLNVPGGVNFGSGSAVAGFTQRKTGWTVGGGMEASLAALGAPSAWSLKLEYLYVDLGSINNVVTAPLTGAAVFPTSVTLASDSKIRDHIIRVGLNYRFGGYGYGARF